jgi:uncharacterized protein (TIGR03643 family)
MTFISCYTKLIRSVIKTMRKLMSKSSFKMWRKRMNGRKTKHLKKLEHKPTRFQGPW